MYRVEFRPIAAKEWKKLDKSVSNQFLKILNRRLVEPRIESARLSGDLDGMYKISLQKVGYRLVYEVEDDPQIVLVIAVGKRANKEVYMEASKRLTPTIDGEDRISSGL
jgi:mRNA interferase RelE/StbE